MRSGTMHLFAISGLHIGVIAATLLGVLRLSQIPPVLRFVLGAGLLWAYVDLIGQTPSALRAWLMITCWHAARVWRAPGNPLAAIATSALLVLLLDPMQLFSAGFQMSYAIVFALLIHGLPLGEHWQGLIRPWRDLPVASLSPGQRMLQAVVAKVLVAAAFTWTASLIGLITSVAYFNWFTPLAFYANIVLVPLAGGVVAAGFAAIILGVSGLGPLALLFNHAAALLLVIMQGCLNLGLGNTGSVPATFFISVWGPLGIMAVLVSMALARELVRPESRWHWWTPTVVSLLVLVIGLRFA
jgi:competence protein ComEC